ncbi:MAG: type II toxin-antitoxin system RelE/ParE family toxin [Cyanobacteriota bacterium]
MKYVITEEARKDLIEIGDYISLDNPAAARNLMIEFKEAFEKFVTMPKLGHKRKDLTKKDVRFWSVKSYLIIYQIREEAIVILRVLSGFRDIATLLK